MRYNRTSEQGVIEFSFIPHIDGNIANWLVRVEKEIDDYIAFKGACSEALAWKMCSILEDIMTNINSPLMPMFEEYIQKQGGIAIPTLNDLMIIVRYIQARVQAKVTKAIDYKDMKTKLLK